MIGKKQVLTLPNCITGLRMAGTLCLLFLRPLSPGFYGVYTLAGLTDALDGWIARWTNTASDLGARLDSIADLLFYAVMLAKIFPVLWGLLPAELWYGAAGVLVLRLCAYLTAAIRYRRFASLHTYLNKLTGAGVFAVPYVLAMIWAVPFCWGLCVVAALASLEELLLHLLRREYRANTKSIFARER